MSNHSLIKQYCNDLKDIHKVISSSIEAKEKYNYSVDLKICEIKLNDIVLKYRCSKLANEIYQNIKKGLENNNENEDAIKIPAGWKLHVESSFAHSHPRLTVVYVKNDEISKKLYQVSELEDQSILKSEQFRIGVQIEGNQFRIYGGRGPAFNGEKPNANKLFELFKKTNWLQEYKGSDSKNKTIRNKPTSFKKEFCQYQKDYLHIYQYWNIEDNCELSHLYNHVKSILKEAFDITKIITKEMLTKSK